MTPEGLVKQSILEWFSFYKSRCLVWPNDSVGIFDPEKKIFRKKNNKYARKGVADILGVWDGQPLAVEVKAGAGRPTPEQVQFLTEFAEKGGIAICAWTIDDVRLGLMALERNPVRRPGRLQLSRYTQEQRKEKK